MLRFYLELTVKNLLRHKRRTILTSLAIAVGILYFIAFDSLMAGADRDAVDNLVDLETGHLQVVSVQYQEKKRPSLKDLLADGGALAQRVAATPGVAGAAPRLLFPATAIGGLDELPVTAVGVDPEADPTVFQVSQYITAGRWLRKGEREAVLGRRTADLLQIEVGDLITIRMRTKIYALQAMDLEVTGLVASPHPAVNQSQIFIPLDVAQEAVWVDTGVTMVAVRTAAGMPLETVAAAVRRLNAGPDPINVRTWRESSSFLMIGSTKRSFGAVLLFLVFLISTIGVVNSILLSSLERVHEIGLLKAMGLREGQITRLFVCEGFGLGLLGGVIGAIMAVLVNIFLVYVGFDISAFMGEMDIGYPITNRFYGAWNWPVFTGAFLFSLVVALAASYFPARKAARLDPVEALRRS